VFEPFTRGNSAQTAATVSNGSGLGLTIAKMLTDLMGGELVVRSTVDAGTTFQLRLFLPELSLPPPVAPGATHAIRRAYTGVRRSVLVVDNEEADRGLLVALLEPMGFTVHAASTGQTALDALAGGLQVDAVLLDLAMPGLDGWETLRRLRASAGAQPQVAIVSANAFDRKLDNGLGIAPEDFFVKPVRHTELLDWLGTRLQLNWTETATEGVPDTVGSEALGAMPERDHLLALQQVVRLGYFRGILQQLQALQTACPQAGAFIAAQEKLARQYQFETMLRQLDKVLDAA
jgi:CheY-like chemotaxis protein